MSASGETVQAGWLARTAKRVDVRIWPPILALLIVVSCGGGQVSQKKSAPTPIALKPAALDAAQLTSGASRYRQLHQGKALGSLVVDMKREDGVWVLTEVSDMRPVDWVSTFVTRMDAESFAVLSVQGTGRMGTDLIDVEASWHENRVTGHSTFPRTPQDKGQQPLDLELPPDTFERTSLFALVHALPLAEKAAFSFKMFSVLDGGVRHMTLVVTGKETVTVPAGTFECWRVILEGDPVTRIYYVTTETPRGAVKWELIGTPWVYERIP